MDTPTRDDLKGTATTQDELRRRTHPELPNDIPLDPRDQQQTETTDQTKDEPRDTTRETTTAKRPTRDGD